MTDNYDGPLMAQKIIRLQAEVARLRSLLARIDNCDAIEINRDYSEEAIAIAEVIWDDIHAALAGQTERKGD